MVSGADLEDFIKRIPVSTILEKAVEQTKGLPEYFSKILENSISETRVSLKLIQGHLDRDLKILEVGAGLCFFSLFLKELGYNVTALEPATGGFEKFETFKRIITEHYSSLNLPVIDVSAENLTDEHGSYDLIFSSNVIEHIPDLTDALDAMIKRLTFEGKMIHGCPNYLVPYEPHLGIVVIKPFRKQFEKIYGARIRRELPLWNSLNLVSYTEIRKYAKKNRLKCYFTSSLLYEALIRIEQDPEFKMRHNSSFVLGIYKFLKVTGILGILRYLPPIMATPMVFRLEKRPGSLR